MPVGHQLSIDCGLNGDFSCQLQEQSLPSINIQAQQAPAQYNYYLFINNQLKDSCQLSVKAQVQQETKQIPWSAIIVKLFYQDQQLFNGDLAEFFSEKISLLNLASQSSKLYRLEFYLTKLSDEFQLDFSLNFHLNCQQLAVDLKQEQQILGLQTEQREPQSFNPIESIAKDESVLLQQRLVLGLALFTFLFCLVLVFLFYRSRFTKAKKLLISSKKGNNL